MNVFELKLLELSGKKGKLEVRECPYKYVERRQEKLPPVVAAVDVTLRILRQVVSEIDWAKFELAARPKVAKRGL